LAAQTFKDFELVLVHRKPEVIRNTVAEYTDSLSIKLVSEKHSIWHDLGEEYCTINNAINTGIIWADGELLISADDCSLWPQNLIEEFWQLWNKQKIYGVPKAIKFTPTNEGKPTDRWLKRDFIQGILREETLYDYPPGSIWMTTYGYCFSVSLTEALLINGFDESLDGAMHGDDGDFGERLSCISPHKRIVMKTPIYFFGHSYKNVRDYRLIRDNRKFKEFIGQRPYPPQRIIANVWRPTKEMCERYKEWHLRQYGSIDENFDKCCNVPMFSLRALRRIRQKHPEGNDLIGWRII